MSRRDYKKAAERSVELWLMGFPASTCKNVTGVDPIQHQHEELVQMALYGLIIAGFTIGILFYSWR